MGWVLLAVIAACGSAEGASVEPRGAVAVAAETHEHTVGNEAGLVPVDADPPPPVMVTEVAEGATPLDADAEPAAPPAATGLAAMTPFRVAAPPTSRSVANRPTPVRSARLRRASSRRNRVTDVDAWYAANQLVDPVRRAAGPRATVSADPSHLVAGHRLLQTITQPSFSIFVYSSASGGRAGPLLAVLAADGSVRAFFDFREWSGGPGASVVAMRPGFAWVVGDVLYVSHYHLTYASRSGGQNAYLSALDLTTGALIWRSAPLESNARSFAVVGDVIVTGYGFTDEKDYLFVLDRHTGRRLQRVRLESGPRFVLERGGRIYVRAYDRDYVFDLHVRAR